MKNLKTIALFLFISILITSCKKEKNTEISTKNTEKIAANLETTTFTIEGMTCAVGCAKIIEKKLTGLNGIKKATVDFETKTATVTFDPAKQKLKTITSTVEAIAGGNTYKVSNTENYDKKTCCCENSKDKNKCTIEDNNKCCSNGKKQCSVENKECCSYAIKL